MSITNKSLLLLLLPIYIKRSTQCYINNPHLLSRSSKQIKEASQCRPKHDFPHTQVSAEMSTSHSDDSEDCVFFWSQKEEPYGFMSQFFECSFEHEGTVYRSAEMWMMVQKARLFGDEVCYSYFLSLLFFSFLYFRFFHFYSFRGVEKRQQRRKSKGR